MTSYCTGSQRTGSGSMGGEGWVSGSFDLTCTYTGKSSCQSTLASFPPPTHIHPSPPIPTHPIPSPPISSHLPGPGAAGGVAPGPGWPRGPVWPGGVRLSPGGREGRLTSLGVWVGLGWARAFSFQLRTDPLPTLPSRHTEYSNESAGKTIQASGISPSVRTRWHSRWPHSSRDRGANGSNFSVSHQRTNDHHNADKKIIICRHLDQAESLKAVVITHRPYAR